MAALALSFWAAPLALAAVALLALRRPGLRPRGLLKLARLASFLALALAAGAALWVAVLGPATTPLLGAHGLGFSLRLDALSVTMFLLVAFLGAVVLEYSRSYLDGDTRQGVFTGRLCLTLAAVLALVLSGNLVQLALAWIGTSLALHGLLTFYAERPKAQLAAGKKFVTARLADACLLLAAFLLFRTFGTGDIGAILAKAQLLGDAELGLGWAAGLIALAALIKSAQFPFHGWLPEVMETPTPVSALLHAGIINAGGFLVIRFADVMVLSAPSLHLLGLVGGFTALFGALVMLTQASVKVQLAWSTCAQMGFMLFQCGLGLFPLAVLHIVAHSLYKAHAFLSAGGVVGAAAPAARATRKSPILGAAAFALALALYLGLGWALGDAVIATPQALALGAILVMGATLLIAQAAASRPSWALTGRVLLAAAGVTLAYLALQAGAQALFGPALPAPLPLDALGAAILALALLSFGAATLAQLLGLHAAPSPFWRAARVHLANGLYANGLFNRLLGRLPHPASPSSAM